MFVFIYICNNCTKKLTVPHNFIHIFCIYFSTLTGIVKEGVLNSTCKYMFQWTALESEDKKSDDGF